MGYVVGINLKDFEMINDNKYNSYNGWYNIYKSSQVKKEEKKEQVPYRAVMIRNDMAVPIPCLNGATVNAVSPGHAKNKFLSIPKYTGCIRDYSSMYEIVFEVDKEALENLRQRKQIEEMERQRKEEEIQDMWWNK